MWRDFPIFGGWSRDHITPNISGWGRKFKNRYSAAICILTRHPDLKYEPNRSRGLGCRGGATDFVTAHLVIWFRLYMIILFTLLFSLIFRVKVRDYDCSEVQAWKLFRELRTCS